MWGDAGLIENIRERLNGYANERYNPGQRPRAAVLVLLYPRENDLFLVFTRRAIHVAEYAGDVSLPGGASEARDLDITGTVLREANEEIGLRPQDLRLIGRLDDYIMRGPSGFHISVFVGELDVALSPYAWCPAAGEVAEILEIPVRHFLHAANQTEHTLERGGTVETWPGVAVGGYVVWGTTLDIVRNFLDAAVVGLDDSLLPPDPSDRLHQVSHNDAADDSVN